MMELLILSELKVGTPFFFFFLLQFFVLFPRVLNNPYVQLLFENRLFNPQMKWSIV